MLKKSAKEIPSVEVNINDDLIVKKGYKMKKRISLHELTKFNLDKTSDNRTNTDSS